MRGVGKPIEALREHESARAIRQKLADDNSEVMGFRSDLALSHINIGVLLSEASSPAEALQASESARGIFQKLAYDNPNAIEFREGLALSHDNIGVLLRGAGKPAEALRELKAAYSLRQKLALMHSEMPKIASKLGATLNNMAAIYLDAKQFEEGRTKLREAVLWQRKALASNSTNPTYRQFMVAHWDNLLKAARGLGDAEGMVEAERELAALRDSDPAMIALDRRLSQIIKREHTNINNPERLRLAQRAYDKELHAVAARLWGEALDSDPKLADGRQDLQRYNAACAAALAGCGRSKDIPTLDDATKAGLRQWSREWLTQVLGVWAKLAEGGAEQDRKIVSERLAQWKQDTDLAGIRDADPLSRLPEAEKAEFGRLWSEVDKLLTEASKAR